MARRIHPALIESSEVAAVSGERREERGEGGLTSQSWGPLTDWLTPHFAQLCLAHIKLYITTLQNSQDWHNDTLQWAHIISWHPSPVLYTAAYSLDPNLLRWRRWRLPHLSLGLAANNVPCPAELWSNILNWSEKWGTRKNQCMKMIRMTVSLMTTLLQIEISVTTTFSLIDIE